MLGARCIAAITEAGMTSMRSQVISDNARTVPLPVSWLHRTKAARLFHLSP